MKNRKTFIQSLWIIPIIAGAVLMKKAIKNQQQNGWKGGKAIKKRDIETTIANYHIDDV